MTLIRFQYLSFVLIFINVLKIVHGHISVVYVRKTMIRYIHFISIIQSFEFSLKFTTYLEFVFRF